MAVHTFNTELASPIAPAKLLDALVLKADALPKIIPQVFKSVELVEGPGGPGSTYKFVFADGKVLKEKIDSVDVGSFSYSYTLLEYELFGDKVEKITYDIKHVPTPDGGSLTKRTVSIYKKAGAEITEEEIKAGEEANLQFFKAVEAYLLANP